MHRLARNIRMSCSRPQYFFTPANPSQKDLPLVTDSRPKYAFLPHVYGLELRSHIFPNNRKAIQLSDEEIKFFQKVSPNYVVGLVRKVVEEAGVIDEENTLSPKDYFYDVATYCKIKYGENNVVELKGLYRSKIEDIKEITIEKNNIPDILGVQPS